MALEKRLTTEPLVQKRRKGIERLIPHNPSAKHRQKAVGGNFNYAAGGKIESTLDKVNRYSRKGQRAVADLIGQGEQVTYANQLSDQYFPNEEEDGRGDALRHLLWQGAVAQEQGNIPAALAGYGHEFGLKNDAATEMDLANNELGRRLGAETKTRDELLKASLAAIEAGQAKIISKPRKPK